MTLRTRTAFTMVEMLVAILILAGLGAIVTMTFNSVVKSWTASTEYMDKLQRSDYALNQIVSALRSMYYPHDGQQSYDYGFMLTDNGDGQDPGSSDVIEWAKTGHAVVGSRDASADTVHRVQVMVLEEGNHDFKEDIRVTGLYARLCPDPALRPHDSDGAKTIDYTFANNDLYQPVLIADGVVGFNCRVMENPGQAEDGENDKRVFEDEWDASNSVPYKVELTFRVADPEGRSYRTNTAPIMRIVRIPVYEQSQDAAKLPSESNREEAEEGEARRRGGSRRGAGGAGGPDGGSGGGPGGGAPPPPGGGAP